jgi:hypothetical protein
MASFIYSIVVRGMNLEIGAKFKFGFSKENAAFSMITRPPFPGATVGPEPVTDCLIRKAS